ncbi:MAG: transposase [Trueperaceae bacterium]|nr:transposase [Trueperaceae bacterium]
MKRFLPFDPDQPLLLPPDLREALPDGHPALLIDELVDQLDLSEIYEGLQDGEWGGKPGFDPRVMVRIWLYAYLLGIRSSRQVAKATVENIAFRVIARNQTPGHWALNRFRTRHRQALGNLLTQSVQVAANLGLVSLANVAIDGTKIKANASKHKAMSYGRMDATEERLRTEIEGFLDECDEQDEKDEETYGPEDDGMSLPEGLRDKQARRAKIAQAKRQLEERAKDHKEREQQKRRDAAKREGKTYTPRTSAEDATPQDSDQINFTDNVERAVMLSVGVDIRS